MVTEAARPVSAEPLLARAARGEDEALAALYRELSAPLHALLGRICRTPEDAEDLLHDTFIVIVRDLGQFRGDGSLAGWAKQIAARQALMFYRRKGALPKFATLSTGEDEDDGAPQASVAARDGLAMARADLESLLYRLPEADRMVLWLHEAEGWTHEELAALFGASASWSKTRLSRAHKKLREWLT